jgi:hypothetical protein
VDPLQCSMLSQSVRMFTRSFDNGQRQHENMREYRMHSRLFSERARKRRVAGHCAGPIARIEVLISKPG